ncbi:MAG: nitroreductase family protein [Deltaproteobacteria bacterium]|nr:nitroreductase family protein [Deltaproteobacteria bacterium]
MEELMSIIKNRRSVRRYLDQEVPDDDLQRILDAVRWSPSWANVQCWEVIVVKDSGVKASLQGALHKTNPSQKAIVEAPVVLVLCGKLESSGYYKEKVTTKFGDWLLFDLGVATQSVCLTATDLGLGTVIVGLFDHDRAKDVLGVGDGYDVVVMIPIGYPAAKDAPAPKRREIEDFTHYERF